MRVWVTNNSGHNFDKALEHGDELVYLTEGKVNIFRTDDLIEDLKRKLASFEDEDYLLFTGNSIVCGLALSILMTRHKTVKLLIFNAKAPSYIQRLVDKDRLSIKI